MKMFGQQPAADLPHLLLDAPEPPRKKSKRQGVQSGDRDDLRTRSRTGLTARVQHAHCLFRSLKELATFGGQRHRVAATVDKGNAEPKLQSLNSTTECRLRHVPLCCRAREAAGSSEAEKILQPFQLHS